MKYAPRAVFSMLMLAGVCVLAAAAILAVATALVVAASTRDAWAILAAIAVMGLLVLVGFGLPAARRQQHKPVEGVLITGDEQPLLWVEICIVAEGLHMWPPRELVLAPDASVIASENRTWLGLRPGVRRLQLGEVLLAGLTERQLRAVIAHELLRFWGPNSCGRIIHRGKRVIGRVLELVGEDSRAGKIVGRYGRAYMAVADPVIRRHQLDADRLSANLVGNGATSAAMLEVAVLSKAWEAFVDGYLAPAAAVHRRPEDVFESFAQFLDHPTRRAQLAEAIGKPQSERRYSSRPSLADRLSAVASLPDDQTRDRSGRALDMLRDPDHEIRRVHEWMFQGVDVKPATWEEIVPAAGRAATRQDARKLVRLGQEGELGERLAVRDLLDILRFGLAEEMVRPLSGRGALQAVERQEVERQEVERQMVERQMAGRLVTAYLATAAIEAGTASYRFSWATPWQLVDGKGEDEDLPTLVDAALADPAEVGALEKWLRTHRLNMDLLLGDDGGSDLRPDLTVASAESPDEVPMEATQPSMVA